MAKRPPKSKKLKNISRIDSKNTHGWYVRVYLNGKVFAAKLFSDKICGGKEKALKYATLYRDHNQMVADLQRSQTKRVRRKPFFSSTARKNSTGVIGVNEVHTTIRGREVHYIQATWSENGQPRSKKFYVSRFRDRDGSMKEAIKLRKQKEKEMEKKWKEEKRKVFFIEDNK